MVFRHFLFALPAASVELPDYFHFVKSGSEANFDSKTAVADGVNVFRWAGTEAGIADMKQGVCAHNVIEWDAGSSTVYPETEAWHSYDIVYFIAQGNATVTVEGETKTMKTGDTLWVQAGVQHSSFTPVDNTAGTIVDALKTPFDPQTSTPPASSAFAGAKHRFYMASEDLTPPKVFHGPNAHYEWYGKAEDPDVLHVWWPSNAHMPCHSHAEGALYVTGWGSMCFAGERASPSDSCVRAGDARWTRPHYQYSNEAAGSDGSEIIVMNIKSNPAMCHALV